jgi:hypothetical protein
VRWDAGGRSDVRLDVVAERAPFDLAVFRQLVRNGFEEPAELRALRRWTRTPNFYVDATNPRTGQPLSAAETGILERAIRAAIPQLTAGQLAAGVIEVGSGPGQTRADYIELTFVHEPEGDFCADALVGANPGRIRINYDRCPSACGSFSPETVAHEVGHAMGFWHTAAPGIMNTNRVRRCDNLEFSEVERFHARVAYSRPPGNLDPDRDPSTFSAIETAAPLRVVCRF